MEVNNFQQLLTINKIKKAAKTCLANMILEITTAMVKQYEQHALKGAGKSLARALDLRTNMSYI